MGKSYGQTVCLVLVAILLVYWPDALSSRMSKTVSTAVRIFSIVLLIAIKQIAFRSEPKSSIYKSENNKQELIAIYDKCMEDWPNNTHEHYITSPYGVVHVLECGNPGFPTLIMFHAASMGAHSWAENLEPIIDHYHIYSFDNPGEGNKSELNDALVFPSSPEEVADLYNSLLDELHIESAVVFGASNGGFIAQNLAYYYPERVNKMVLFGPMGLTQLTKGSIAMMGLTTVYPFQFLRDAVADWAIGTAPVCHQKYGAWFNAIMKGTIPSVTQPIPMTTVQKQQMDLPILLFLGSNDKIVGDAQIAQKMAEDYPNIQIEILNSGHLMAVEKKEIVNEHISNFLE
jgi:pimeloyl-ACP methyl ester carboxylesterase